MNVPTSPVRTCIGCRVRFEQNRLTRFVPDDRAHPVASRTAAGRGAWLCTDSPSCRESADKKKAFDRAWKTRSTNTSRTTMTN